MILIVKPFDYEVICMNNYFRGNKGESAGYTYRLFLSTDIMHSGGNEKYQENNIYVQTGRQIIWQILYGVGYHGNGKKVKVKFTLEQDTKAQRWE